MNLNEILNVSAISVIHQECGPFLSAIDSQIDEYVLYRGIANVRPENRIPNTDLYYSTGYRDDRKPKMMPTKLHNRLNDMFLKKFGFAFRNGVFATGSQVQAEDYGTVYQFFPAGRIHFCWSPKITDLSLTVDKELDRLDGRDPTAMLDELINTYQTTDLKQAISSGREIMFVCEKSIIRKKL